MHIHMTSNKGSQPYPFLFRQRSILDRVTCDSMLDRSDVRKRWTYFDIADIISKNLDECKKKTQQANQL